MQKTTIVTLLMLWAGPAGTQIKESPYWYCLADCRGCDN